MKTPVTVSRIRNHFTYSWWKYALLIVIAVLGWDIIYTVTRYRAPEDKKVVLSVYVYADSEGLESYMTQVNATEMPEMEEMYTIYTTLDSTYTDMIFSTHLAAGEGDVFIINRDMFQRYAASAAFLPLEEDAETTAPLEAAEISLSQGWRTETETGERHLYGIPCANLPGITRYIAEPQDAYIVVAVNNQNDENVLHFLHIFLRDMLEAPELPAEGA